MTGLPFGWPCNFLMATPPGVDDRLSSPTGEEITGQVAGILTPRGPAWGTDEVGDGSGASPIQRLVWTVFGKWSADIYARDFNRAMQVLPSALTSETLPDWEEELGLPDRCLGLNPTFDTRKQAVRHKWAARGSAAPAYFVCLAASHGYDITITEPSSWRCGVSECGAGLDQIGGPLIDASWIVNVDGAEAIYFRCGEGECGVTPLSGVLPDPFLECILGQHAPPHTILVFRYTAEPQQYTATYFEAGVSELPAFLTFPVPVNP